MGKSRCDDEEQLDAEGSNERADALTHIGPFSSHLSLHRLFLDGLLPSRARLRFTGWVTM
jgi:hypothetical protein